jgi:predicted lipid-binding transport protein (Tim44 family)
LPHSLKLSSMDIIFFAAIAFFIFYKLNKQLGKIDEEEKKNIELKVVSTQKKILEVQQAINQQQQSSLTIETDNQASEKILNSLDAKTKESFDNILNRTNISAEFFINGVKSAFEMILKAFASSDLETLKFLLSDKIFKGFESAIIQRKSAEKTLITNLISIEKSEIISALIFENNASVVMKIVSKQINYIIDSKGQTIEGRKDEINEITDIWTFKKDVNSANPNWVVSATGSN